MGTLRKSKVQTRTVHLAWACLMIARAWKGLAMIEAEFSQFTVLPWRHTIQFSNIFVLLSLHLQCENCTVGLLQRAYSAVCMGEMHICMCTIVQCIVLLYSFIAPNNNNKSGLLPKLFSDGITFPQTVLQYLSSTVQHEAGDCVKGCANTFLRMYLPCLGSMPASQLLYLPNN